MPINVIINTKMSEYSTTNKDVVTEGVSTDSSCVTGCVKWFNNKAGYGFITVSSGPYSGDVFVHHSAINVNEEQYRFLVQGEYVEFDCVRVENGPHEWQASNVTGPNSGKLMCETRRAVRSTRPTYTQESDPHPQRRHHEVQQSQEQYEQYQRPRRPQYSQGPRSAPRHTGPGNSNDGYDGYEWLLVRKNDRAPHRNTSSQQSERPLRPPHRVRSVAQVPN